MSNAIDSYQDFLEEIQEVRPVVIKLEELENEFIISVQDYGCGVPLKIRSRIFEPLFTTKNAEMGMGIGLSISKKIVEEDYHGKISFTSEEGEGTTFFVFLPRIMSDTKKL